MATLLKDLYYPKESYLSLAKDLNKIYPKFEIKDFYHDATQDIDKLSLKERIRRATDTCYKYLPQHYPEALEILLEYTKNRENNFYYLFLPEYVATYGLHDFERSLLALKEFTKFSSSEIAIRYFLLQDFKRTMTHIRNWTSDPNHHVRRLCSEGTRPRLPWAMQLKDVIKDPSLTLPIISTLKADDSKYVQKSVANHINDISKDHPEWIIKNITNWDQDNQSSNWIIKHGMRSLLKDGNKNALALFGFNSETNVKIKDFKLSADKVKLGETIKFTLKLQNLGTNSEKIMLDYAIYFVRKNNKQNRKVFKLISNIINANMELEAKGKYSFDLKTTRTHYPGKHKIALLLNGNLVAEQEFDLYSKTS